MITLFDSHFHIINYDFPLFENNGYKPRQFLVEDYRSQTSYINIVGGALVAGSYHGFDNRHLLNALKKLGAGFAGVAQIAPGITDRELNDMNEAGIRGIRFNLKRRVYTATTELLYLGNKVFNEFGWHTELYTESSKLEDIYDMILNFPSVSIDHLGLTGKGFNTLLKLVEKGVKVKATGFGRVDLDIKAAMRQVNKVNPESLMFGTDLPSTRAPRPFILKDLYLVTEIFDEDSAERILSKNAMNFYGFV